MSDIKTELWAAASEAFPEGEVTLKALAAGHPKIASRKLPASYYVRVSNLFVDTYDLKPVTVKDEGRDVVQMERKPTKVPYAVSGMYPQDGSAGGIKAFIEELKSDSVRIADSFPK